MDIFALCVLLGGGAFLIFLGYDATRHPKK